MNNVIEYDMLADKIIERSRNEEEEYANQYFINNLELYTGPIINDEEQISLKQSALDKLKLLGLTEDEAKAIVGL